MTRANSALNRVQDSDRAVAGQPGHAVPYAERTAIYCRKSRKGDREQVTVNRQKRLALQDCEKLGLAVSNKYIFIDNGASAWQRNRKRDGWDRLLEAARRGEVKHIVCYHPDRLMRQPFDLEELLSISDKHGIMLYGRVNKRDLQDADDRYALRIEVAHACRSSDDTSRRLKDQKQERAEDGYYNGTRPYGYRKGMRIVPKEAAIVREIFDRYGKGETPFAIATDLNERGIKTARGSAWSDTTVRRQLRSHAVAAICVHQGREIGRGKWPAIIDRQQWDFTQELRMTRSRAATAGKRGKNQRFYLLRGLVVCGKCGTSMTGCSGKDYRCARAIRQDDSRCSRSFLAEPLEDFIQKAAINLLSEFTVNGRPARSPQIEEAETEIAEDEQRIKELNDMWKAKEITTSEWRELRKEVHARIRKNEHKTVANTKRSIEPLADLIGPDAGRKWKKITDERKNAVLRFLFGSIVIGEHANPYSGTVDYTRIDIDENELV